MLCTYVRHKVRENTIIICGSVGQNNTNQQSQSYLSAADLYTQTRLRHISPWYCRMSPRNSRRRPNYTPVYCKHRHLDNARRLKNPSHTPSRPSHLHIYMHDGVQR